MVQLFLMDQSPSLHLLFRLARRVRSFTLHLTSPLSLKGYSSGQSHFSEINVKLAEKSKYATHSIQRSLEISENKEKLNVSEDFRQKKFYQ